MELLQAINERRSVREYTDEPVSDAVVRELIDAALQAPSAINQQPWCFVVVKDPVTARYFRFTESQAVILELLREPMDAEALAAAASEKLVRPRPARRAWA